MSGVIETKRTLNRCENDVVECGINGIQANMYTAMKASGLGSDEP